MPAKDTALYWKTKVTKRKIRGELSAHYYARMSHQGIDIYENGEYKNSKKMELVEE